LTDLASEHVTTVLLGLISAIPTTLVAWGALKQGKKNQAVAQSVEEKTDGLVSKTNEIHALADGNLGEITKALAGANEKIANLERLVGALMTARQGEPGAQGERGPQGPQGKTGV
jgi:hypothetical protein